MFDKNKTKTEDASGSNLKIHTMQDDIARLSGRREKEIVENDSISKQEIKTEVPEEKVTEAEPQKPQEIIEPKKSEETKQPEPQPKRKMFFQREKKTEPVAPIEKKEEVKKTNPIVSTSPFLTNAPKRNVDEEKPKPEIDRTPPVHNFFPKTGNDAIQLNREESNPQINGKKEKIFRHEELFDAKDFVADDIKSGSSVWTYVIFVLVIFILIAGGYYFWVIRGGRDCLGLTDYLGDGILRNNIFSEIGDEPSILSSAKTFSEKSNYLVVDAEQLENNEIKKVIEDTFSQMRAYNGDQLEFVLVDKNNSSIKLAQFMQSFGIKLDKKIMEDLSNKFSIILSKKDGNNRLSLVLNLNNKDSVLNNLKKEEVSMLENLKPILLDAEISPESKKTFADGMYNDVTIRYMNLNDKPDLSIDYMIFDDYLIFATSKESGRLVLDRLAAEKEDVQ